MTERSASVLWNGSGKEGVGEVSTEPGAMIEARCQEIAASARRDCPLSRALAGVATISLAATLDAVSQDKGAG